MSDSRGAPPRTRGRPEASDGRTAPDLSQLAKLPPARMNAVANLLRAQSSAKRADAQAKLADARAKAVAMRGRKRAGDAHGAIPPEAIRRLTTGAANWATPKGRQTALRRALELHLQGVLDWHQANTVNRMITSCGEQRDQARDHEELAKLRAELAEVRLARAAPAGVAEVVDTQSQLDGAGADATAAATPAAGSADATAAAG